MSVTKRVRFEVLRRDQGTCQYCGRSAPDVALHVDHVVPQALGGTDEPSNLVAACIDCNSGKASTKPDGPLVEAVSAAAASFSLGLRQQLEQIDASHADDATFFDAFLDLWEAHVPGFRRSSWRLPPDARASVSRWHQMGVGLDTFDYAIRIAVAKKDVVGAGKFSYMAGVIWNVIRTAEEATTSTTADVSADDYERGRTDGATEEARYWINRHAADNFLMWHVDGKDVSFMARAWKAA